ncbi:MAG: hypothetical protein EPO02_00940 [Nitrospirae bacterium]|nr:MAG: hypothetical protein EPO02_00940 [Nitrospirota bacterium]
MPMRTAEVTLDGQVLATYEIGWHESDAPPTDDWMRKNALHCAWDEGLLPEERADDAVVTLGS